MLKNLPVKKEYLLVAATFLLLLICYKLAFKQTLEAWQTNRKLTAQLTQSTDLSYQPGYLIRKNANLNKVIDLYKADTTTFRTNSVSSISIIADKENVKLSEVPSQDPFYHTDKFLIQKLALEGNYFSVTKTLNDLQSVNGVGIIRSASYKLKAAPNSASADKGLVLEIYLEIVK